MIIAANWKMNPPLEVAGGLANALSAQNTQLVTRILLAPHPYLIPMSVRLRGSDVRLGGQDCHQDVAGAHTGDVSAAMLRECGASVVLLGHSERRINHGEKSSLVAAKARQAIAQGMDVIVCLGETLVERQAGHSEQVVIDQLRISVSDGIPFERLMIAYEPVWAIGTGEVASLDYIAKMHGAIASEIPKMQRGRCTRQVPILYGGSVNAENATSIFSLENGGGGLIGGASLNSEAFDLICRSACSQMSES